MVYRMAVRQYLKPATDALRLKRRQHVLYVGRGHTHLCKGMGISEYEAPCIK